jgi:quercetin dioxygenase-like cupin family protein
LQVTTIVGCTDLDEMTAFFVEDCGGLIETITPADAPREVTIRLGDARICLRLGDVDDPVSLIIAGRGIEQVASVTAPNGTVVEFRPQVVALDVPPSVPSLSIVRAGDDFGVGRAGMHYRDLLPDRWGGRFIASHILIPQGGPVPDYVHFHRIRFQLIFCARGWVDVVYEDQGVPFRLEAGDCVLQPPEIRHRVLASSPGMEVIEIGCPAEHDTFVEHDITLPTGAVRPDRSFGAQRFVHHVAADTPRRPWLVDGLRFRDTGIAAATDGLGGAVVVEAMDASPPAARRSTVGTLTHDGEFVFSVVLDGSVDVTVGDGPPERLEARDAVAFPPGTRWAWRDWSDDFEMLQVTLPDAAVVCEPVGSILSRSD